MGEGWGDFFATAIRLKPNDNRNANYVHGEWVNNSPKGNRLYPYSTNLQTNPLVYTSCNKYNEVHAIGTVWCSILYEVLWNLIDKHGKNDGPTPVFENGVPNDGKYLAMKLVLDGMAMYVDPLPAFSALVYGAKTNLCPMIVNHANQLSYRLATPLSMPI